MIKHKTSILAATALTAASFPALAAMGEKATNNLQENPTASESIESLEGESFRDEQNVAPDVSTFQEDPKVSAAKKEVNELTESLNTKNEEAKTLEDQCISKTTEANDLAVKIPTLDEEIGNEITAEAYYTGILDASPDITTPEPMDPNTPRPMGRQIGDLVIQHHIDKAKLLEKVAKGKMPSTTEIANGLASPGAKIVINEITHGKALEGVREAGKRLGEKLGGAAGKFRDGANDLGKKVDETVRGIFGG